MTAYLIYQAEVLDPEAYEAYKAAASRAITAAGGRYLVRGGHVDVLEGDAPRGRTVVLEFPSRDAALAWYESDDYQAAMTLRLECAKADLYLVDGIE